MGNRPEPSRPEDSLAKPLELASSPFSGDISLDLAPQIENDETATATKRPQRLLPWPRVISWGLLALSLIVVSLLVIRGIPDEQANDTTNTADLTPAQNFKTQSIPLSNLDTQLNTASQTPHTLKVNGQLTVSNSVVLTPSKPSALVTGQLYYDQQNNKLAYYNGSRTIYLQAAPTTSTSNNATTVGAGLTQNGSQISNAGVLSIQGQTGVVSFSSGNGIKINGTTVSNSGLLSLGGQSGKIGLGNGLDINNGKLSNNGVVSLSSGSTNLVVTNSGNGNLVITSTGGAGGTGVTSLNGLGGDLTVANATASGTTITLDNSSTSQKGIAQFNSTNFTSNSGLINTVQNINTTASPTFNQLTTTSSLVNGQTISGTANFTGSLVVAGAASLNSGATVTGNLSATTLQGNGASVTNVNALTLQGDSASFFTNATNITSGTLSDARLSANIPLLNGVTNNFTGTNLEHNGNAVCDASNNCNYLTGSAANGSYVELQGTTPGTAQTGNLNISGTSIAGTLKATTIFQSGNQVCDTSGNCTVGGGGSGITGSGTADTLAMFTATGVIGSSIITQSGTTDTVGGTLSATNLQGNGSGITSLNASNIASGTLADARLSANVPLLNAVTNNFTGTNLQHNGNAVCDASNNCNYLTGSAANGTYVELQSSTPGVAQTGNFNISGIGIANTFQIDPTGSIDTTGTGNLNIGTSNATTINLGTGTGAKTFAIGGTGANNIDIGNTQTAGSVVLGSAMTTGILTVGGTAQIGMIMIGQSSATNILNIANGTGSTTLNLAVVQNGGSINEGLGMTVGTITIGGTAQTGMIMIGQSSATNTLSIANGIGATTVNIAVVQNGGSINEGLGMTTGTITLGGASQTGMITVGQSTATNAIAIGSATGNGNTQTINIGTSATAGSTTTATLGSTTSASTTTVQGGGTTETLSSSGDTIKDSSASASTLLVENAGGNGVLRVDTNTNRLALGSISTVSAQDVAGTILLADGTTDNFGLIINTTALSNTYTLSLPATGATGSQCLESTSGSTTSATGLQFGSCGSGSTTTLQQAYNNSAGASPSVDMTSTNGAFTVQNDNPSPITGELFGVHANAASGLGSSLFSVSNTGATSITSSTTTGNALGVTDNSLTTGSGVNIASSSAAQTAGSLLNVNDTATLATNSGSFSGNLLNVNRSLTANVTGSAPAPAYDTSSIFHNNGISGTWSNSFTVGSHTNRFMLITLQSFSTTSGCVEPTSISYNGSTTTVPVASSISSACAYFYGITAPAAGTANVSVVFPSTSVVDMEVSSWYNINQTSPTGTFSDNFSTGGAPTVSAASVNGQLIVDQLYAQSGSSGSGVTSSQTTASFLSYNNSFVGQFVEDGTSYKTATGTSTTMSWSNLATYSLWVESAIGLNPATTSESVTGSVASLSNNCSITAGACSDNSNVLSINQQYSGATGAVVNIQNSGSGAAILVQDSSNNTAFAVSTNNVQTGANSANSILTLAKDSGTGRSINAAGSINANGADYAEYFPQAISGELKSGDVACLNSASKVELCNTGNGDSLIGVVSTNPGYVGNDIYNPADPGATALVGLLGQINVKTSTANGPIQVGDMLTYGADGVAVKATGPGMTIGSALTNFTGNGTDEIQVYVHVGYYDPTAANLQPADSNYIQQGDAAAFSALTVNGDASIINLSVTGNLTTTTLTISGHIVSSGDSPTIEPNTVICSGAATASIKGTDTAGLVTFTTPANCNPNGKLVTITFSKAFTQAPNISLTPANVDTANLHSYVDSETTSTASFNISAATGAPTGSTTNYNWYYQVIQ